MESCQWWMKNGFGKVEMAQLGQLLSIDTAIGLQKRLSATMQLFQDVMHHSTLDRGCPGGPPKPNGDKSDGWLD